MTFNKFGHSWKADVKPVLDKEIFRICEVDWVGWRYGLMTEFFEFYKESSDYMDNFCLTLKYSRGTYD
jgi:hypothetical protein